MLKTGSWSATLKRLLALEYLIAKDGAAVVKIVLKVGIGGQDQTRIAVHHQKLLIALGLIHSSKN